MIELKILDSRLSGDKFPQYATDEAAAIDLRACNIQGQDFDHVVIAPGGRVKFGAGFAVDCGAMPPSDWFKTAALVLPRSGLGSKGYVLSNLVGLIDGDYQGEIIVTLWNASEDEFTVKQFDRIAQMMFVPVLHAPLVTVIEFSRKTRRGTNGFGSTGTK